jgi:penicillin-binding protein 2
MTEKVIKTASTRGNIYDRNGNVLAYNELAYDVTIQDTGAYKTDAQWNTMLYDLVSILNKHGESAQTSLELTLDHDGNVVYTSETQSGRKRFLRDYYGLKNVDEMDDSDGKYPSDISAPDLLERMKKEYHLTLGDDKNRDGRPLDKDGNPIDVSDEVALQIVGIRYTMRFTAFQKYESTTIATDISDETVADILEHAADLVGVNIQESTIRVYNESLYFAPIIGYTGKVTSERLEELKAVNDDYELNDVVGRTGIESSMELELKGKKGSQTAYVDNVGRILSVTGEVAPVAGNDIWLTLDLNLQKGIYHILEKQLAGVLLKTIVNQDEKDIAYIDSSSIKIPIKKAYFQLINNNVLSIDNFASEEASDVEQQIYQKYESSRVRIEQELRGELQSENATPMNALSEEMQAYMQYIYSYLSSSNKAIVQRDAIDTSSDMYQAWKNGTISLREYLYYGIANNWIDTTKLDIQSRYSNADDVFTALLDDCFRDLEQDPAFEKLIYQYLINNNVVTGRELCMALYSQNVLAYDENEVNLLRVSGEEYAYQFLMNKIRNIEITPAQLALDPCTGGVVITDVNTGEVRALVTYPSYDNNRLSGSADPAYMKQLQEDLSLPLYNNATQAKKAPGSTFKPITAIAGLEEKVIGLYETIDCTGEYKEVDPPIKCWIYPGHHGPLTVVGGIQNSCNYFFAEVAHRLATNRDTLVYSTDMGVDTIRRYASMFGLNRPSGIEIPETTPELTTEDPERSAMGQGTNSYSNVQLSRYVAAIANSGTVYDLSLLDKMTDSEGNLIKDFTPEVTGHVDIADSTWDAVHQGMRAVVTDGSVNKIFKDLEVEIAGKTGTAQESRTRGNHAFFISYGPYTNPEICVTVNIPYGYSSSNAAMVAKNVYRFYYGYTDLDSILGNGALEVSNVRVGD